MCKNKFRTSAMFIFILLTCLLVFWSHTNAQDAEEPLVGFSFMFEPTAVTNAVQLTIANHGSRSRSRGFGFVEMANKEEFLPCESVWVTVIRHPYNTLTVDDDGYTRNPIGDPEVVSEVPISTVFPGKSELSFI